VLDTLGSLKRTSYCGALRAADADKDVVLMGWVQRRRDLGQLIFIDLRDRAGIAQIVFNQEQHPEAHAKAEELRSEFVVAVEGRVVRRQKANPEIATGEVEVVATRLHILNNSKTPPFPIEGEVTASEETRLRYRYLDLRRPKLHANIELRHRIVLEIRKTLDELGFFEIETPMLTRSTPEGARDYLVPSRVHHGQFYALPQSPQIFKQILMISGMDRYFQIVKCFRDEDLRADRQPEFTQVDLEMSFPTQDAIFGVIERVMQRACAVANGYRDIKQGDAQITITTPFPRMTYEEAMLRYGSDKPDLRYKSGVFPLDELVPVGATANLGISTPIVGFHFSQQNLRIANPLSKTAVKNLIQTVIEESDKTIPEVAVLSKAVGKPALFIDWCIVGDQSQLLRRADLAEAVSAKVGAAKGDILFLAALRGGTDPKQKYLVHRCLGILRNRLKDFTNEYDPKRWEFLWITGFALFEWSEHEKAWVSAQHPFTGIFEEDIDKLETAPWECRSKGYDLVLNGYELGSGSIRIHRQDVQAKMFKALGLTDEQARQRFGFFLDALTYGTPPHGGIALGVDRIAMLLAGEKSLREVIAFPKTTAAQDLMAESPSEVSLVQLYDELGLIPRDSLHLECRNCGSMHLFRAPGWSDVVSGAPPAGAVPPPVLRLQCLFCGTDLSAAGGPPISLRSPYQVAARRPGTDEWREQTG
jgi:aspartyl-tRNA synthetase